MDYKDELVFLTISQDIRVNGSIIKKGQDLPLVKSSMVKNLKEKNWQETIPFVEFLFGMVLCFVVDPSFAESKSYDEILKKSPYHVELLIRIMESSMEDENKMDFLKILQDLRIREEDVKYFLTNLKEEKVRKSDLRGDDLERAIIDLVKNYEKIPETSPFYGQAHLHISGLYAGIGHYIKARYYAKELLLKPLPEEVKNQARQAMEELEDYANMEAVESYLNVNDLERAKTYLEKVSAQYPNPDHIHYFLGTIYLGQGNLLESKEEYKKALKESKQGLYYERLAFLDSQLGLVKEAIENYELALQEGSDPYTIHHNLAYLYGGEDPKQAIYHAKAAYNIQNTKDLGDLIKTLEKSLDGE